jgi:hypothetical protein
MLMHVNHRAPRWLIRPIRREKCGGGEAKLICEQSSNYISTSNEIANSIE